jgi:hypothetical protein
MVGKQKRFCIVKHSRTRQEKERRNDEEASSRPLINC